MQAVHACNACTHAWHIHVGTYMTACPRRSNSAPGTYHPSLSIPQRCTLCFRLTSHCQWIVSHSAPLIMCTCRQPRRIIPQPGRCGVHQAARGAGLQHAGCPGHCVRCRQGCLPRALARQQLTAVGRQRAGACAGHLAVPVCRGAEQAQAALPDAELLALLQGARQVVLSAM